MLAIPSKETTFVQGKNRENREKREERKGEGKRLLLLRRREKKKFSLFYPISLAARSSEREKEREREREILQISSSVRDV